MKKAGAGSAGKGGKSGVAGHGSTGKSGTVGNIGKITPKVSSKLPTAGKLPSVSSPSNKNYGLSSYKPEKKSTFGIIWLPTKKRNKHKDEVYNSHKNDRSQDKRVPSMYNIMSGDSSHQTNLKKKEEETVLIPERSGTVPMAIAGTGAVAVAEIPDSINKNTEDPQESIKQEREETKEAAGDANDISNNSDKDLIENNEKDVSVISEKGKLGDNVDSVFLRSPPPHKTRSNTSTNNEEEDCGIKCLYYVLQCCDCTIM